MRMLFVTVEAIHMANLLCQHGYFFPVGECNKGLAVKDDSSLYRFQVRRSSDKKSGPLEPRTQRVSNSCSAVCASQ